MKPAAPPALLGRVCPCSGHRSLRAHTCWHCQALTGSSWLCPGQHNNLVKFKSPVLPALQEGSLGKGLHSFEMRFKHTHRCLLEQNSCAHDKGEEVAQFTWQRAGSIATICPPTSPCPRSTDLPPRLEERPFIGQILVTFPKLSPG